MTLLRSRVIRNIHQSSRIRLSRLSVKQVHSLAHIRDDLLSRNHAAIPDFPTPIPSLLLAQTLGDLFLERYKNLHKDLAIFHPDLPENVKPSPGTEASLLEASYAPPAFHLVYFPPPTSLSSLLSDGTDPLHSPGPPFTRRVWAGCSIVVNRDLRIGQGTKAFCHEQVRDVEVKGTEGEEKVFVHVERNIFSEDFNPSSSHGAFDIVQEVRTLVFMRDWPTSTTRGPASPTRSSIKLSRKPEFIHTLTPSASLLFRFSALTFNAHAIHLDKQYCQAVEGHRNLLVHGPLTVILMAEMLRLHLADMVSKDSDLLRNTTMKGMNHALPRLRRIDTRNVAPLYADEPLTICGRKKSETGNGEQWELWIEDQAGSLAAKGTATTSPVALDA